MHTSQILHLVQTASEEDSHLSLRKYSIASNGSCRIANYMSMFQIWFSMMIGKGEISYNGQNQHYTIVNAFPFFRLAILTRNSYYKHDFQKIRQSPFDTRIFALDSW